MQCYKELTEKREEMKYLMPPGDTERTLGIKEAFLQLNSVK